jgi:hypothetical protein
MLTIGAAARLFWHRNLAMYATFSTAYSTMLLAWNYPPDERFLLPLMPILIAAVVAAISGLDRSSAKIAAAAALTGLTAVIAVSAFGREFPTFLADRRTFKTDRDQAFAWMRANTSFTAQVFTQYDWSFHMATSRPARLIELQPITFYRGEMAASSGFRQLPKAARNGETYAIDTAGDMWRIYATDDDRTAVLAALGNSRTFRPVYRNGTVTIYRVLPE